MELVELDALELEPAQAHFDALNQISSAADVLGFGGALAGDAALGGDDEAGWVGIEGLADEAFGDLGAVGIGCVDEGDAELDGAAENAAGFFWIRSARPRHLRRRGAWFRSRGGGPGDRRQS